MTGIEIITDKCVGCKLCVKACMFSAIDMKDKKAVINDNCTLCGACVSSCKFDAIQMEKEKARKSVDISEYKGVWVFAEQKHGVVSQVAFELLGEGRKLADTLSVPLSAVLIGNNVPKQAKKLIAYGADNVYYVEHQSVENYNDESYTDIFVQLI